MFSKYYTISLPTDGSWTYQTLAINENDYNYEIPQNFIVHNGTDKFIKIKIMSIDEGEGATFDGNILRGNLDQQFVNLNTYKIGLAYVAPNSAGACYISTSAYRKVTK